jgi:ribosomal protein S30
MSMHGGPLLSIRNQIERKAAKPRRHGKPQIRNPEAYAKVVEDAKRLGLTGYKRRPERSILNLRTTAKVTLPKLKCLESPEDD